MNRTLFARILVPLGVVALVLGGWSAAQFRYGTAKGPLLNAPSGVAVAPDGTIFVGVGRRIHGYDPEGQFLREWPVPSLGEPFRLRLVEAGGVEEPVIEVALQATGGKRLRFDLMGELLDVREDATAYESFGPEGEQRATRGEDTVVELRSEGLVRVRPGEPKALVKVPPPPLSWLGGMPLFWLMLLLNGGVLAILAGVVLTGQQRAT